MDNLEVIEKKFCSTRMKKLLGKHTKLVMNFPSLHVDDNDFLISQATESLHVDLALSTATNICDDMYEKGNYYSHELLKEFSRHPSNLFWICEYNKQYFGHMLFIYLKPNIYEQVMRFELDYKDITINDIASTKEEGSYFSIGMFSMNDKALSLLVIHLYAHFIVNQEKTRKVGTLLSRDDALNMATNLNLKRVGSKNNLIAYSGSLKEIFLNEQIIKILFS